MIAQGHDDFVIRYKGKCTLVEVKANTGNASGVRHKKQPSHKKVAAVSLKKWSRRESNPRPKTYSLSFYERSDLFIIPSAGRESTPFRFQ